MYAKVSSLFQSRNSDCEGPDVNLEAEKFLNELAEILPGIRIIVANSYSSTEAQLRWRGFIPLIRPMKAEEIVPCFEAIIARLNDKGFPLAKRDPKRPWIRAHGFDPISKAANTRFYAPSQAGDPSGNFFRDYSDGRELMNPDDWCHHNDNAPRFASRGLFLTALDAVNVKVAAEAIEQWQSAGKGEGDAKFRDLALKLRSAGYRISEVQQILEEQTQFATIESVKDRKDQIPRLIGLLNRNESGRSLRLG